MRVRSVTGWSSRGISKDCLMHSSGFHAASPGLRKSGPAKILQKRYLCATERLGRIVWLILVVPLFTAGVF